MQLQIRLSPNYSGQFLIQEELIKIKTSKKRMLFSASNKRIFVLDLRNREPIFSYGKTLASLKLLSFTVSLSSKQEWSTVENISSDRKVAGKAKFGMKLSNINKENSASTVDLKVFTSDALILDLFLTAFSHLYFTSTEKFLYEGHDQSTRMPLLIKAKSQDLFIQKRQINNQMHQIGLDGLVERMLSASSPHNTGCCQIVEELSFMTSEQDSLLNNLQEESSPYNTLIKRKKQNKYGSGYLVTDSSIREKNKRRSTSKGSTFSRGKENGLFLKKRSKSQRALRLNLEDLDREVGTLFPQICINGTYVKRRYMMVDSITSTKMEKHLPDTEPIFDFQD